MQRAYQPQARLQVLLDTRSVQVRVQAEYLIAHCHRSASLVLVRGVQQTAQHIDVLYSTTLTINSAKVSISTPNHIEFLKHSS